VSRFLVVAVLVLLGAVPAAAEEPFPSRTITIAERPWKSMQELMAEKGCSVLRCDRGGHSCLPRHASVRSTPTPRKEP
jgi:hypothetical protein